MNFEEKEIKNATIVIDHFGYWPTFHDAEIISIKFERTHDKANTSVVLSVYAFEMTSKLNGVHFEHIKHCFIDIEFVGINKSEIEGFNHQNAVSRLTFGREGTHLFCSIDAAYGVDGYIESNEIKINALSAAPNM